VSFVASRLSFAYGLREASFKLPASGMVAIAGPNGAGKSTLLGIMAGLRQPYLVLRLEFPFTAEQVVFMGRTPYAGGWFESPEDHETVARAMETTDTTAFRARDFRSLSGGERQRVILASALAQEPETLLLDEPTTFLDLKHQFSIYGLLSGLRSRGMLIVAVTHDLNLALQFSDHAIVLDRGRIAAAGEPASVLTPALIQEVFGVRAAMLPRTQGRPWIVYERPVYEGTPE
jgi:iron complex transport system ATP-binding protein